MVLPAWGAHARDARLMAVAEPAALCQLGLVGIAFLALTHAYVTSDFSVENVWANSHSAKPLIYRISGVWGNHEGSMLLWVLILPLFGAAVAAVRPQPAGDAARQRAGRAGRRSPSPSCCSSCSRPIRSCAYPPPAEGRGLNPILQDPALAFHPPFLYAGYVGLSMAFSFAVAALIEGRTDAAWARWVRPWTLAAWICLTLGIAMGSWWAYYELGWGGWWFWDPVENASFMPWLAATALLHSALVMEKREALKVWTILLAILAFSLSLMGTFLVRSGVLTSVHAFAVDPQRGVFILAIMVAVHRRLRWRSTPGARRSCSRAALFAPISREGALVLNNVLLTDACATVFIGTLYPLALESLTGDKISVGPPYFNSTFGPLMIPLLLAMPFGPFLAWKRGDSRRGHAAPVFAGRAGRRRHRAGHGRSSMARTVARALRHRARRVGRGRRGVGIGCARASSFSAPLRRSLRRARGLPRAAYGTVLAHCRHRPHGDRHRRHHRLAERGGRSS